MTRKIVDWKYAAELLKLHSGSKCQQDSSITARIAKHEEQQKVIEMQCAWLLNKLKSKREKNREIVLKLMRSVYFVAKNHIAHSTTYKESIELQGINGD